MRSLGGLPCSVVRTGDLGGCVWVVRTEREASGDVCMGMDETRGDVHRWFELQDVRRDAERVVGRSVVMVMLMR